MIRYLEKARRDREIYKKILDAQLESIGLSKNLISQDEIETFCKNSRYIKTTFGSSLHQIHFGELKEEGYCKFHKDFDMQTLTIVRL